MLKNKKGAQELIKEYEQLDDFLQVMKNFREVFDKINNDVYNITLSLQVQDITSQQLAAVNHLIESVRQRLSSLIIHLDETELNNIEIVQMEPASNSSFNPEAKYTKSQEKQDLANVLVNQSLNKTSQDEIDKLFS